MGPCVSTPTSSPHPRVEKTFSMLPFLFQLRARFGDNLHPLCRLLSPHGEYAMEGKSMVFLF